MIDTLTEKTAFQRATDVIQSMDRGDDEDARASLEFLREQLRGTCGDVPNTSIIRDGGPCLLPAGHTDWHDDGAQSYLSAGDDRGWSVAPSRLHVDIVS